MEVCRGRNVRGLVGHGTVRNTETEKMPLALAPRGTAFRLSGERRALSGC